MSTFAILGATGNTGLSILKLLGESPKNKIHVLVRSRSKLEKLYPALSTKDNIQVFEGSISDTETLAACLSGAKAAFLTVATNANQPGCSISIDTAQAVVAALKTLKIEQSNFKPPRLVVLSSASLDDRFWRTAPSFVHNIMWKANSNIYTDLQNAEDFLRQHDDWLDVSFLMPGGITHDVQQGHELSTESQQAFISFLDVAAAMIEVADEESNRWGFAHVGVVLKGMRKARLEWWAPLVLSKGLLIHFFPLLFKYLP